MLREPQPERFPSPNLLNRFAHPEALEGCGREFVSTRVFSRGRALHQNDGTARQGLMALRFSPHPAARVGSVRIEVGPALSELAYRCYPDGCPRDRTCCVGLAVSVSRREVRVIDSLMDELARLVPTLRQGDGYADVFAPDANGMQIEPRDERGTCPFLFRTRGRALCAIHR